MRATHIAHALKLNELADAIYYSAAIGFKKPDHSYFNKVIKLAKIQPEEVVLIDDTFENIVAAKQCGWHAIHWSNVRCLASELTEF